MNKGYAVLLYYWNGNEYVLDWRNIVVYATSASANDAAEQLRITWDIDGIVNVVEVEVRADSPLTSN